MELFLRNMASLLCNKAESCSSTAVISSVGTALGTAHRISEWSEDNFFSMLLNMTPNMGDYVVLMQSSCSGMNTLWIGIHSLGGG